MGRGSCLDLQAVLQRVRDAVACKLDVLVTVQLPMGWGQAIREPGESCAAQGHGEGGSQGARAGPASHAHDVADGVVLPLDLHRGGVLHLGVLLVGHPAGAVRVRRRLDAMRPPFCPSPVRAPLTSTASVIIHACSSTHRERCCLGITVQWGGNVGYHEGSGRNVTRCGKIDGDGQQ